MKNESQAEADLRALIEAQRILIDKERSAKPTGKDIEILAEAKRIQDDEGRSDAVRSLTREKKKSGRKADIFAGEGSFAGKLKARREAMESGDEEGAGQVFIK